MTPIARAFICILLLFSAIPAFPARAETVRIAVAANFTATAKILAETFEKETGNKTVISFGSTGALYAQIKNGAPFEIFLAADMARPERAQDEGLAVKDSLFTYAVGKLVLYSADPSLVDAEGKILSQPERFAKLAIANPKTAPYGAAAKEVLIKLDLYETLKSKIINGNSVTQTFQVVSTKNADLAFIALSQLRGGETGSKWMVPQELYPPIRQGAVLLNSGASNQAAKAFLAFLRSDKGKAVIQQFGYGAD